MNDMITLKLKNGTDIVGQLAEEQEKYLLVFNPVEMHIDQEYGFFAKSYLMMAEGNTARFNKSDLLLMAQANEKACHFYEEFSGRLDAMQDTNAKREDFDTEGLTEDEDMMRIILESKFAVKH
jgi:hypothetical protein